MTLHKLTGETFKCDRCGMTWTDSWNVGSEKWSPPSSEHRATVTLTPNKTGRPYDYDVEKTAQLCGLCNDSFREWLRNLPPPPAAVIPAPTTTEVAQ